MHIGIARAGFGGILFTLILAARPADAAHLIHPMDTLEGFIVEAGNAEVVREGPEGQRVIRIAGTGPGGATGRTDAAFAFRFDLAQVDIAAADILTLEVDAARAAMLLVSLENFPEEGLEARWYVLDGLRGPTGWRRIYVDLSRPEEIRRTDGGSGLRLRLRGSVKDTGRGMQGEDRVIRLGPIQAASPAVQIDWDQRTFTYEWSGSRLIYRYPIAITNRRSEPVEATLRMEPFRAAWAQARVEPSTVALAAGAQETALVEIVLPDAQRFQPLYAERFEVWARAQGADDMDVTILRSADPIHLPVVVPLAEETLAFPLLPPPDVLPAGVVHFDPGLAASHAGVTDLPGLIEEARARGIYNYRGRLDRSEFRRALISAAYLFRFTGDPHYLETARTLLNALPDVWAEQARQYADVPHPLISSGIIVRMDEGWHYTLGLGWRLAGTQRSPYYYGTRGNGAGGSMSAIFYAFDMLAPHMNEAERERFIHEFAVPAAIQSRNHYIGDGNQQSTANAVALYAGLISRNWPLVAFATSSEHGLASIIEWTHTDEGMHIRDGYQTYSLRPIFFSAELLFHRGIDVYETYFGRLEAAVHWRGGRSFEDHYFWEFVTTERMEAPQRLLPPSGLTAEVTTDGTVTLRWRDQAPNEAWFIVERRVGQEAEFVEAGRSPEGWTAFQEDCTAPGAEITYRVFAMNYRASTSDHSNTATVSCP